MRVPSLIHTDALDFRIESISGIFNSISKQAFQDNNSFDNSFSKSDNCFGRSVFLTPSMYLLNLENNLANCCFVPCQSSLY